MISGWVVKVLVTIALIGFAVVELGSPLIAKAQVDDAAHAVADEAAFRLRSSFLQTTLDTTCASEAAKRGVALQSCEATPAGVVSVSVTKQARSFLLAKFKPFADWYVVEASATASTQAN